MNNAELVKMHGSLAAKQREFKAAERAIAKAQADMLRLEREIDVLEKLTEVRDGIALDVRRGEEGGIWIEALGRDIRRCAGVYLNAHNRRTFGLHTYSDSFGRAGEEWAGADFTPEQAERLAFDWVLRGVRPPR